MFKLIQNVKMGVLIRITICWLCIFLSLTDQTTVAQPMLIFNSSSIIENETFTMQCIANGVYAQWIRNSNDTDFAVIGYSDGQCISTSFIKDQPQIFNYSCDSNETFNIYGLTLKSVSRYREGEAWHCRAGNTIGDSNKVVLRVLVPVMYVTIQGGNNASVFTIQENTRNMLTCISSYCRPAANITWFITDGLGVNDQLKLGNSHSTNDSGLESTVSSIELVLNRTYNGLKLVCKAKNIPTYTGVFHNITLNITYTTNEPKISHCLNDEVYQVIQNTKGKLTCTVDGGNPAGTLNWNCSGDITEYRGPHNSITQTVVWNATQTQHCTCNSTNIVGTRTTSVKTEVLYTPVIDEMQNITVFEGDSVTLQCDVIRANPPVSQIRWTSKTHNASAATTTIRNVSRSDDMVYTCIAYNTMDPSCGNVVQGNSSKSLHVEVLYPPYVNISLAKTFTVKEGDTFSYTCPVVPGNPPSTNTTWRRPNDTKIWSSSKLMIINVTRYDDSVYTCYATSRMVNTYGTIRIGNVSADIRLNVLFKTIITDFYMQGYRHNSSVFVMENTSLMFTCRLQSNPTADARIYKTEDVVNSSYANELLYYTVAYCSGGPVNYSCQGNNSLNNEPSTRLIQLFVNCIPRQDINANVQFNATCAINQTVTLSYKALAYPHPSFVWYRDGSSITNARIIVSSIDLRINLTITNVEESDFGEYILTAQNDFGSIKESFHLKPDGVPEVPTHLTQDDSSTSISSLGLNWRSGFKNGSEQNFTLMFKRQTEEKWQNATVPDTGPSGTTIHYNITGLSSGTSYDIVLFAVNAKGRSKSNATLTCRTKEPEDHPGDGAGNSATIGAAGGSAAGLLLIGVVIVGVVIFRRRSVNSSTTNKLTECSTVQSSTPDNYENLKIDQIPNAPLEYQSGLSNDLTSETNVDHTYEGLSREDNGKENEYAHLGNNCTDDHTQTYENLKIQL